MIDLIPMLTELFPLIEQLKELDTPIFIFKIKVNIGKKK